MSIENVTVEDLRTVAHNLQAEGQNSRAELIYRVATQLAAKDADLARLRQQVQAAEALETKWKNGVKASVESGDYDKYDPEESMRLGTIENCADELEAALRGEAEETK